MDSLSHLWERVGVRVFAQQPIPDRSQNAVGFLQHLSVVETQYRETRLRERRTAALVGDDALQIEVLTSIQLDHQACLDTREVGNEGADGVLAAELEAFHAPAAQLVPETALGVG